MKLMFGRKTTPELCPQYPVTPSINAVSHRQEQSLGLPNFWCSESCVLVERAQTWQQTGFESWTCHWLDMITALPCDLDSHLWSKDHNICIVKLSRGPETLSSGGWTSVLKPHDEQHRSVHICVGPHTLSEHNFLRGRDAPYLAPLVLHTGRLFFYHTGRILLAVSPRDLTGCLFLNKNEWPLPFWHLLLTRVTWGPLLCSAWHLSDRITSISLSLLSSEG